MLINNLPINQIEAIKLKLEELGILRLQVNLSNHTNYHIQYVWNKNIDVDISIAIKNNAYKHIHEDIWDKIKYSICKKTDIGIASNIWYNIKVYLRDNLL